MAAHKILALFRGIYVRSTLYKAMRETAKRLRKLLTAAANANVNANANANAIIIADATADVNATANASDTATATNINASAISTANANASHNSTVNASGMVLPKQKKKSGKKKNVKGTKKWLRRGEVGSNNQ